MCWEEDLKKLGFKYIEHWNNRFYYEKNGFKIVEHYGFSRYNKNNPSGYGDEIKIEQLDEEYKKWKEAEIKKLEKTIKTLQSKVDYLKNCDK